MRDFEAEDYYMVDKDKVADVYWLGYDLMKLAAQLYSLYILQTFRLGPKTEVTRMTRDSMFQFYQILHHMDELGLSEKKAYQRIKGLMNAFEFGGMTALEVMQEVTLIADEVGVSISALQTGFVGGNETNPYFEARRCWPQEGEQNV